MRGEEDGEGKRERALFVEERDGLADRGIETDACCDKVVMEGTDIDLLMSLLFENEFSYEFAGDVSFGEVMSPLGLLHRKLTWEHEEMSEGEKETFRLGEEQGEEQEEEIED